MKFSINQNELLNALTIASKATSSRSTLPVLSGVYIETIEHGLILQTTNGEQSIRYTVQALIEEPGKTVIPEKILLDIVKNLPDAAVTFESRDTEMSVTCDKSSFVLKTLEPEDFPSFPELDITNSIILPFNQFCSLSKRVARFTSKEQSRGPMTGVLVRANKKGLTMVSSDAYRLAVVEADIDENLGDFEAIVAGTFLQEVASLPRIDENIQLGISENQIVVSYQNMVFVSRRIEGKYMNYQQLIPDSYVTKTCFTTSELTTAIKRVSLMTDSVSTVKFEINADSRNTFITAVSKEIGAARETMPCEVIGEPIQVSLNFQYLLEGLGLVATDQVFLETTSSMKPVVFKSMAEERFTYLIMPIRSVN